MGHWIELSRGDGSRVKAYRADATDASRGTVVVLQEIFGVNQHIRSVCERFAQAGYHAVAPALFERIERNVELDYSPDGIEAGKVLMSRLTTEQCLADVEAAASAATGVKPAVVGYCWGGTLAFAAATRLGDRLSAAVCYYGGGIGNLLDERPRCPVQFHLGAKDQSIPAETIDKVREALPDAPLYVYDAGHGFNCDARGSYEPVSAKLAFERTIAFLQEHAGGQ